MKYLLKKVEIRKVVEDELYFEKRTDKSLKDLEDNFRKTLKEGISEEHRYKREIRSDNYYINDMEESGKLKSYLNQKN